MYSKHAMSNTIWLFAYGSLIWDRPFEVLQEEKAILPNFSRRFCVYSHVYRGTYKKPGLVLGLDKGDCCEGLIFEISEADYQKVYEREMVTKVYHEVIVPMEGKSVRTFVADCAHPQYAGQLSIQGKLEIIKTATGKAGSSAEYFLKTIQGLQKHNIQDNYLEKLLELYEKPI